MHAMHAMQLSLFADADLAVDVPPTSRGRRSRRPSLAAGVAAVHGATDADAHALAIDAVLTRVTPRVVEHARLFAPSWPDAHVEVDDLTQEVLLEVAASLDQAPCTNDAHTQAWLSALVTRVLHQLWRAAMRHAADHRTALAAFALEMEPDASAMHPDDPDAWDDEPGDATIHARAA